MEVTQTDKTACIIQLDTCRKESWDGRKHQDLTEDTRPLRDVRRTPPSRKRRAEENGILGLDIDKEVAGSTRVGRATQRKDREFAGVIRSHTVCGQFSIALPPTAAPSRHVVDSVTAGNPASALAPRRRRCRGR